MKSSKFRPGRAGCESLMFEVEGYLPGTNPTTPEGARAPMDTLRICGADIHEVAAYLKKWEPHFSLRSVRVVGIAILLSGSPYQE